jgi:Protein of unknwon function (DUF3008)
MKITQIIVKESSVGTSTSGSVATVSKPLGEVQKRTPVAGLQPAEKVMKGKAKKKGPYQNSIVESRMGELDYDLKNLKPAEFKKKYGKTREEVLAGFKKQPQQKPQLAVSEAELQEDDFIIGPGLGRLRKSGFVKHDPDKAEHEGETLKNSLHTIMRAAKTLDNELSMRDNFPEWVSEKIGSVKGMMVSVVDYLLSAKEMKHDPDAMQEHNGGVIAGGISAESSERPKNYPQGFDHRDRDIGHVEKMMNHYKHEYERRFGPIDQGGHSYAAGNAYYDGKNNLENYNYYKSLYNNLKNKDVKESQLDELSKDTLKNYVKKQPERIKGPNGLAQKDPNKAARIVDLEKGDIRRALTKLKDPKYGKAQPQLDEKAVSKAQQRFMGMAHAIQKGKKIPGASSELKSVAKGMTKKAAHDFAATKHKGLPEKVKKK